MSRTDSQKLHCTTLQKESCSHRHCLSKQPRQAPRFPVIEDNVISLDDVASVLGSSALRRPSRDDAVGYGSVGDWSYG